MSSSSRTFVVAEDGRKTGQMHMHDYTSSDDSDDEELQFESRLKVKYVQAVLSDLSEYKKFLVEEMGFGGMLKLPVMKKVNLKFSYWLMVRVDTRKRCINISQDTSIPFWDGDFAKVFGVPCGPRDIHGHDGSVTTSAIDFMKATIGMTGANSHSLKPAEAFIKRDITEDSSGAEKECFKASVVIFVWGHILCPSRQYDYTTINFWGVLCRSAFIGDYNRCSLAMTNLMDVDALQAGKAPDLNVIHLFACHLFLQIFYVVNLYFGPMQTIKHSTLPRLPAYSRTLLATTIAACSKVIDGKKTYDACTIRQAIDVCYIRRDFYKPPGFGRSYSANIPICGPGRTQMALSDGTNNMHHAKHASAIKPIVPTTNVPQTSDSTTSAFSFYEHLWKNYPLMNKDKLLHALRKRHGLRIKEWQEMKEKIMKEDIELADLILKDKYALVLASARREQVDPGVAEVTKTSCCKKPDNTDSEGGSSTSTHDLSSVVKNSISLAKREHLTDADTICNRLKKPKSAMKRKVSFAAISEDIDYTAKLMEMTR